MKNWKVIIDFHGNSIELEIQAKYYSDAYIQADKLYPGCIIKSITEIRPKV